MNSSSEPETPPRPPNVACFATSHGFGHATRAVAILRTLAKNSPGLTVNLFSTLPDWFWTENLSPEVPYHAHQLETDVGLVQKSPFEHDLDQTITRLERFLAFDEPALEDTRKTLRESKPDLILCDVSPLGLVLGKELGIPTVLVENFTWDWIYGAYLDEEPRFEPFVEQASRTLSIRRSAHSDRAHLRKNRKLPARPSQSSGNSGNRPTGFSTSSTSPRIAATCLSQPAESPRTFPSSTSSKADRISIS